VFAFPEVTSPGFSFFSIRSFFNLFQISSFLEEEQDPAPLLATPPCCVVAQLLEGFRTFVGFDA